MLNVMNMLTMTWNYTYNYYHIYEITKLNPRENYFQLQNSGVGSKLKEGKVYMVMKVGGLNPPLPGSDAYANQLNFLLNKKSCFNIVGYTLFIRIPFILADSTWTEEVASTDL